MIFYFIEIFKTFKSFSINNFLNDFFSNRINIISSKWNVQRAYRVKGGTLIEFQEKEIQVPKKYTEIYERNVK